MSVKVRFLSPGDVGTMGRSSSFAGFSSVQSRKISKSLHRNSMRSKMPVKSSKVYATLRKGTLCLDPKPQQVKRIFEALKKGLKEYLCVQKAELDYLSGRHKDTRRNSRLAFYYDLDKQTRSVERHIRKMEFHISKVEELYEGYCIQCRLRDGASNMQQAFALSPLTKASRESLVELYRNLQECTEDMCLIEGALEVHLGEFHVKMKGLVGYARLCPGDQYEVFIRLGRQRWKLKGKIETDDSQTWDEEEKVFIPTLHEHFEIKVLELRGLSTLLVGTVTCELEDFFTTRPQTIVVDITELGTIKLQLEVTWNPFDTESFLVSPGISKYSVGSRKGSLYNWTPPNTPSFREKYYLSLFQQQQQEQPGLEGRRNSPPPRSLLSYLSESDLGVRLRGKSTEQPEVTEGDSFSSDDPRETETGTSASTSDGGFPLFVPDVSVEGKQQEASAPCSVGLSLKASPGAGDWHMGPPGQPDFGTRDHMELLGPRRGSLLQEGLLLDSQLGKLGTAKPEEPTEGLSQSVEKALQEVLDLLKLMNPRQSQLRELEYQVLCFRDRLKPKVTNQEHSSMESLMETILESFDFLNADFNPDELSLFGSGQAHSINNDGSSQSVKASAKELTAGIHELDVLLVVHLQVCRALLQKLMCPNLSTLVQECLLEEVLQQKEVLEKLSVLDVEKVRNATSADELIPQAKKKKRYLKMWSECTEPGGNLFCSAKKFQNQLKKMFLHKVKGKYPGQLEIVCHRLLEQVVSCSGLISVGLPEELITWFQFQRYLEKQNVVDLEKHFAQLTKEVTLLEDLQCAGRLKKIKKLKGKRLGQLQPLPQTLKTWALLQLDENHRVRKAAIARLLDAAGNRSFREKALLYYTSTLSDSDAKLQQASCLALKYLKGMESIDQIASLCQSDLEDVRTAARESTLSFGEKGRLAFEKMDRICPEVRESLCQDADIEITVF